MLFLIFSLTKSGTANSFMASISAHLCDYFCGIESEKCIAGSVRQILESVLAGEKVRAFQLLIHSPKFS